MIKWYALEEKCGHKSVNSSTATQMCEEQRVKLSLDILLLSVDIKQFTKPSQWFPLIVCEYYMNQRSVKI